MQLSNLPARIVAAFAVSGSKRTIPVASQIGVTPGAASFTDGFPPLTFLPLASGGVPPAGQDFNGLFNAITLIQQWQSAGGSFAYDAAWSTANNGYPKGAQLLRADGTGFWLNQTDNNTTDPDGATPTGWVPGIQYGITAIAGLTNANVTLTSLQYGKPIITLAGTLTGNVQIIFPALIEQWLIVNNTTGAFSVTAKTAAGTGQIVPQGQTLPVWGDGTNLNSAAAPGRLINIQVITATQTYTPTFGTKTCRVRVQAGGGAGGGCGGTAAGQVAAAGGGGGGGYAESLLPVASVSGLTATIGAGGTSVVNAPGTSGGSSSLGPVSASGGAGGTIGSPIATPSGTSLAGGSAAGVGAGGNVINQQGGYGTYGAQAPTPLGGAGGASAFGSGAVYVSGTSNGAAAISKGSGGGGGSLLSSIGGGSVGGIGAAGIILVEEYA